jgi:hypothetical protein
MPAPTVPVRCFYCERRIRSGEPRTTEAKRGQPGEVLIVCPECTYAHELAERQGPGQHEALEARAELEHGLGEVDGGGA